MQKEITDIRRATIEDMPGVAALTQRLYALKRNEQFYAWYFLDPEIESELYCAYDRNELVGMLGIHHRRLNNNLICGHISGINVAPEYAGKGAFLSLVIHVSDLLTKFDLISIFANNNATTPCEYYFGMNFKRLNTLVKKLAEPVDYQGTYDTQSVVPETRFAISSNDDCLIKFQHSEQFRQWRFGRHPLYRYVKVECDNGDFTIVKTFTEQSTGVTYGDIVDLECPHYLPGRTNNLVLAACKYLYQKGVKIITLWATPGSKLHSVVQQLDFHEGTSGTNWGINIQNTKICSSFYSLANWHLCQSDASNY